MMTLRERVLAVLNRQKPDVVPWLGDLAYYFDYLKETGGIADKYKESPSDKFLSEKGIQQFHRDLGIGFYLQGYFPFKTVHNNVSITLNNENGLSVQEIETPYGKLRNVWQYLEDSYCWGHKEHMIKSTKDLKALRYLYENTSYEPDYELAQIRKGLIGDNGVLLCYLPKSPLMECIANLSGIEALIECLSDEPGETEETLELMGRKHDEAAEIALNSPAECLMIPENISSEVVGKVLYENYMKYYEEKWVKCIRNAGKYSFVHLDGTMRGLIRELSDSGFDVIEALTTAPVGDIAIEELHQWVREDTIMWGGLPGALLADSTSDAYFDEYVIRTLNIMKTRPGYVLGVADQVPPKANWNRLKRVGELVEKYGRYDTK